MRWFSHVIFSLIVTISFLDFLKVNFYSINAIIYMIFSAIVSTFPDVDIKKNFNLFEKIFYYTFFLPFAITKKKIPHRKITHSLFFMIITSIPLFFLDLFLNSYFFCIYILSYFSHIFLDSLTPSGVQIFSPFSKAKFSWKIKTGSLFEYLFLFSLFTIFYLVSFFRKEGMIWLIILGIFVGRIIGKILYK